MTESEILFRIEQAPEYVLAHSWMHCHAPGVTSIGLFSNDREGLRLFFTSRDHRLHNNFIEQWALSRLPMAVGFHGHRRDVYLSAVHGTFYNITAELKLSIDQWTFRRCLFKSRILGDRGPIIVKKGPAYLANIAMQDYQPSHYNGRTGVAMKGYELHTIAVKRDARVCWAVHEGKPCQGYEPSFYTNVPPAADWDLGLYQTFGGIETIVDYVKQFFIDAAKR